MGDTFEIKLVINGKEKLFTTEPTGADVMKAAEIMGKIEHEDFGTKLISELENFVVELFGNQFSADDLRKLPVGEYGNALLKFVSYNSDEGIFKRFISRGRNLPKKE